MPIFARTICRTLADGVSASAARVQDFYPADVHLVDNQAELLANVAGAQVVVVESLAVGAAEIATAGKALKIVQKYGVTTPRIDQRGVRTAPAFKY